MKRPLKVQPEPIPVSRTQNVKDLLIKLKFLQLKYKVAIAAVLVVLSGGVVTAFVASRQIPEKATRNSGAAPTEVRKAAAASCTLPKVEVKEHAFTIGVPAGWIYELNNGTVSIMKDKSNTTGVFLYTAKLQKDLPATELLTAAAGFFTKAVAGQGGSFAVGQVKPTASGATAVITASLDGQKITGQFNVEKQAGFMTMRAYYAPVGVISTSKSTLEQVTRCFERTTKLTDDILTAASRKNQEASKPVAGFTQWRGRYFAASLPAGFRVTGESDSGVDMSRSDDAAGFSYAYVTGAKGPYSSRSWAAYALPRFAGIQSLSLGAGRKVQSAVSGMSVEEYDFSGVLGGAVPVKGKTTVGVMNTTDYGAGSSTSAFWAIQVAKPSVWPSVAAVLQKVQDSVTITDIGDTRRKTMLPPNRPMESGSSGSSITSKYSGSSVSDESNQGWSDAMRGYEEMESPTTGQKYDVPYNAYNPTGPDGAGYYRGLPDGGLEKLE